MIERAPDWFLKEMRVFDPDLRVRWSSKMNMFQLERKITHSLPIETKKRDSYDDDYIRAKEGYILVALIAPGKFSRNIFSVLRASDLWSNGGWESVARAIEDFEASEEEAKWKAFSDELRGATRELYNFIKIRDGRTIYSPGYPE